MKVYLCSQSGDLGDQAGMTESIRVSGHAQKKQNAMSWSSRGMQSLHITAVLQQWGCSPYCWLVLLHSQVLCPLAHHVSQQGDHQRTPDLSFRGDNPYTNCNIHCSSLSHRQRAANMKGQNNRGCSSVCERKGKGNWLRDWWGRALGRWCQGLERLLWFTVHMRTWVSLPTPTLGGLQLGNFTSRGYNTPF